MRKDALGIIEVEIFTDLSKSDTIKAFQRIKEDSAKFTSEHNCDLGLVFSVIGFVLHNLWDRHNTDLLKELGAPLSEIMA